MKHCLLPNKISRFRYVASGVVLALALTGCGDHQPGGQTAATVNGEPITETAINMEIAASQGRMTRQQAIATLVERALIVEQAKKQKLDQRPQFTLELARASSILLSKQYAEGLSQSSGSSLSSMDISDYLANHPELGSGRRQIFLKQIIFSSPTNPALRVDLEAAKTYTAFIEVLQAHGIKYEEGNTTVDTALAPEQFLKSIASVQPGEPFVIMSNGQALANVVDKEVPVRTSSEEELVIARAKMQQVSYEKKFRELIETWKKGADIKYAPSTRTAPRKNP